MISVLDMSATMQDLENKFRHQWSEVRIYIQIKLSKTAYCFLILPRTFQENELMSLFCYKKGYLFKNIIQVDIFSWFSFHEYVLQAININQLGAKAIRLQNGGSANLDISHNKNFIVIYISYTR